jgi:hypothetical protein
MRGVEPHSPWAALPEITEPLRPATLLRRDSGTKGARFRRLLSQRGFGAPTRHDVAKSLRQESNPHLGLTRGACLPLNTTEAMKAKVAGRTRTGAAGITAPSAAIDTTATKRGRDSNPRSRAHEAREDSRSSTAQVWLAGVEPAISGFQGRRGVRLPHSQRRFAETPAAMAPAGVEPASPRLRAGCSAAVELRSL